MNLLLKRILDLERQSKQNLIILGLVLVVLLGVVDFFTGNELEVTIFYLLPISIVAWFVERRYAVLISILATVMWFSANELNGSTYSHPAIFAWNTALLLGFFLIITYALSALRQSLHRQDELMHFIVHDLRSPLSNVMTGLQLLDEPATGASSLSQKELIATCTTECDRMLTLINSILDLARLEKGQMPLHPAQIDVKQLVDASIAPFAMGAKQKPVTLISELDPEIKSVYADQIMTERVLVNLVGNAIKFSPPGSTVTTRVAPGRDGMLAFSVEDHGRGIPPKWVGKVFDRFAQVDSGSDRSRAGSGLGLSFCRLAVEAQGGHIWIDSEVGRGTAIMFTLPTSRPTRGGQ